ncbi:TRAP transporter small permease [Cytobacillus horneckiae]|uniref:TRAP transporter small permease n=1 Tax=Cytobacillus horneckiae TaxID=549687 RepID=UPI00203B28A8|nr:TRAP transporter small permease [Cytobacillus horneckiae]MCM3179113.1 TRAP transporter small permease [Cytobacillus horneckiae]
MVIKWLKGIDDIIATVALAGIIVFTSLNVFFRFVLNNPISWAEEITLALFIWMVFIGISSAMKRDGHVGVDYFVKKMPKPLRILSSIVRAVAIYYALIYVLIFLGLDLTSYAENKLTPVLGLSYQFIDIAVPIGGLLTAIHFTRKLIRSDLSQSGNGGGS